MLLLGVCGCLIPIAVHLFNTSQSTPTEWAAMEFLVEAWAQVKRKTRFHNYTLLATRCCIPLVIGLILSNPTTSAHPPTHKGALFIVIDNGVISTTIPTPSTNDLEINKQNAIDQINQNKNHHQYFVLATSDIANQPIMFNNTQDALGHINNIQSTHTPTDIPSSLSKIQNHLHTLPTNLGRVYVASQFRFGSLVSNQQTRPWPKETTLNYSQPAIDQTQNIKIDSIQPLQSYRLNNPNTTEPTLDGVEIHLSNDSDIPPKENIQLEINYGDKVERLETRWPPGVETLTVQLNLPGSHTRISIQILNPDSLVEDNTYYISLPAFDEINTTIINRLDLNKDDVEQWLRLALKPHEDTPINIVTADPATLQGSTIQESTCVFLLRPELCSESTWSHLHTHVLNGGLLVVFPPPTDTTPPWVNPINKTFGFHIETTTNTTKSNPPQVLISSKNTNTLFPTIQSELNNLVNPVRINKHTKFVPDPDSQIIFELEDGDPAVTYNTPIQTSTGGVVLFSFSLDSNWTNLPTKPFMVPLVQELVRNSFESKTTRPTLYVGDTTTGVFVEKDISFIQQGSTRVSFNTTQDNRAQQLRTPGHWTAYSPNNKSTDSLVVNIDRRTTNTNPTASKDINNYLGKGWAQGQAVPTRKTPYSFQEILVLVLTILVVLETILAKRISIKNPQPATPPRGTVL